jgi:energy-coupling factor transporter ATP-binding protein EcfA2
VLPLREVRFQLPNPRPDGYPWNLPVLEALDRLAFPNRVTFLIGDNGSGKSTVIEALAKAAGFNPEGGSRHAAYDAAHTDTHLADAMHLVWNRPALSGFFFRAERFFAYTHYLEEIGGFDASVLRVGRVLSEPRGLPQNSREATANAVPMIAIMISTARVQPGQDGAAITLRTIVPAPLPSAPCLAREVACTPRSIGQHL